MDMQAGGMRAQLGCCHGDIMVVTLLQPSQYCHGKECVDGDLVDLEGRQETGTKFHYRTNE